MAKTWIPRRRRKRQQPIEAVDLWRRLRVATTLLAFVLLVGTLGYIVLGLGPVDALYQTVITVSTVGYREVGAVDTAYKIFSMILILFGAHAAMWGTLSTSIRQAAVPLDYQGRVSSVYQLGLQGGLVIGAAVGAGLAGAFGVTAAYWFGFVGSGLILVLIWRRIADIAVVVAEDGD